MSNARPKFALPELTEEMKESIAALAMAQMSHAQIADYLEMTKDEFIEFKLQNPEVVLIIKKNRAKTLRYVAQALIYNATQMKDTNAQKFFLERKGGWHDKKRVEVTGKNGKPIQSSIAVDDVKNMSADEAREKYNEMCQQD